MAPETLTPAELEAILDAEVCEAFDESDSKKLRANLVQVAAVAVNWIEAIDRRGAP